MNKPLRVALVAFIVGLTMLLQPPKAFAATGFADITCGDPITGEQMTFSTGWDNSNPFFQGRGNIAQLYCEGGWAGPYTIYISDSLPVDSPQRYYAGIAPTTSATPSASVTIEPTPMPSLEPSIEPSPIPTLEPSIEPTPEPTQNPEPLPSPTLSEPTIEPVVQPTQLPKPTPEPTQTESPTPQPTPVAETPEPTAEPLPTPIPSIEPTPTPSLDPQEVTLEVPTQLLAIPGFEELAKSVAAIMNIGSDMTPEQREESQTVVISAVLVSQIATSIRRIK